MIIKLLGENLLLEDQTRDNEEFDVTVDVHPKRIKLAKIEAIHDQSGNEISLEDIDISWATAIARGELIAMKEEADLEREAMKKEIDL